MKLKLSHWFPCIQDWDLDHHLKGNKCAQRYKNPLFGSSYPLMGASSLHTSTNRHWWGLSSWYVWSGGLVHSMASVHFWSLAWGKILYSFDSLLQGDNFSSLKSAATIAFPHLKLTAYFCSCIPHIIHHPEMALSLSSFPDSPLLTCLLSSVSYFNSVSPWALWPRSLCFLGTQGPCSHPSSDRRAKSLYVLIFFS